jgi:peptidoglycan hydrolase-like protein with peptidoglycan-binding domain
MGKQTEAEALRKQFPALFPVETTQSLSVPAASYTAFVFSEELRAQMTHPDVKELQKYLNQNGFALAQSGNGSRGNETDYFGTLTQHALTKFQNAHALEILQPIGLSTGTGFFGRMTIKFINL